jgi:hypothetical protein
MPNDQNGKLTIEQRRKARDDAAMVIVNALNDSETVNNEH